MKNWKVFKKDQPKILNFIQVVVEYRDNWMLVTYWKDEYWILNPITVEEFNRLKDQGIEEELI